MASDCDVVLVVEDDAGVRESLAAVLQLSGYEVAEAANGEEALRLLHDGLRPCVILLDLMMPVMNGWTFRERQLRDATVADIPVVVVSALADHEARTRSLRASALLRKPVDPDRLMQVLEQHC